MAGLENYLEIGRGGFATVYSADDQALGRKVAVKVLRHLDDDGVRRFQREARILADLGSHENLAGIYRFAQTANGNPCFVMEYVPGGSLAGVLTRTGAVEPKTAISYASQVARALMHTHARGIVHRDIKPSNILLADDGRVKLSDFGIAVIRSASATLNAATFEHAAPEVFLNGATKNDERSDLYSLASTLFTLIDGSAPYHIGGERSHEALLHRVLNGPIPITDRAPQLNGFWPKALAKEPEFRFQTAAELLAALTALRRDTPPSPGRRRSPAPSAPGGAPRQRAASPPPPPPPPGATAAPSSPPPPPSATGKAGGTISITATGQQLSPQEVAVVDSFADSPSAAQRREVASLTTTQSVLFKLAQDRDNRVATTAVPRITDYNVLGQLIEPQIPKRTRVLAAGRVTTGPLAMRLADDPDPDVRAALASGVTDPEIIQRLIADQAETVRAAVIGQLQNPKVLRLVAQSPDPETRRAIARHTESDDLLVMLARDSDDSVRNVALSRVDPRTVLELAANHDEGISRSAIGFVRDPGSLLRLSRHPTPHVQHHAVAQMRDNETLARIAGDIDHPRWREALQRINDEPTLASLARHRNDRIAQAALDKIPAGNTLTTLAGDPNFRFRLKATDRITDPDALASLAGSDDGEVASKARGVLHDLSERNERLATARLLAAGIALAAIAVALVSSALWPYSLLVIGLVGLGYRSYASKVRPGDQLPTKP